MSEGFVVEEIATKKMLVETFAPTETKSKIRFYNYSKNIGINVPFGIEDDAERFPSFIKTIFERDASVKYRVIPVILIERKVF